MNVWELSQFIAMKYVCNRKKFAHIYISVDALLQTGARVKRNKKVKKKK